MNKIIYEYPIDTKERIAECSSCGKKFAPTLNCVAFDGSKEYSDNEYAACRKCRDLEPGLPHLSEWFKKQTRDITDLENEEHRSWIADGERDPVPKAFRDAYCWKKYSPEEIAEHAAIKKKYFLGIAVILIILFSYAGYVMFPR
jgi:hypothetical protein